MSPSSNHIPRQGRRMSVAATTLVLVAVAGACSGDGTSDGSSGREAAYLKVVRDNNIYRLAGWGDPSDEDLLEVGQETCTSLEETEGAGGAIGTLDTTLARLGLDRTSSDAEIYIYTADEAVNELCQ